MSWRRRSVWRGGGAWRSGTRGLRRGSARGCSPVGGEGLISFLCSCGDCGGLGDAERWFHRLVGLLAVVFYHGITCLNRTSVLDDG